MIRLHDRMHAASVDPAGLSNCRDLETDTTANLKKRRYKG